MAYSEINIRVAGGAGKLPVAVPSTFGASAITMGAVVASLHGSLLYGGLMPLFSTCFIAANN